MTFTLPEDLAAEFLRRVPARNRSRCGALDRSSVAVMSVGSAQPYSEVLDLG